MNIGSKLRDIEEHLEYKEVLNDTVFDKATFTS